jgi:4-hydroxy-tetrahydrodipicolinate synthase
MFLDVLELGEAGLIGTSTHVFGDVFRRMVDEPERRREIHASLTDVYRDMGIAPAAATNKAALNLLGLQVGAPRLPYIELDDAEVDVIRALLERHSMLVTAA